jgi:hypothetical protein
VLRLLLAAWAMAKPEVSLVGNDSAECGAVAAPALPGLVLAVPGCCWSAALGRDSLGA